MYCVTVYRELGAFLLTYLGYLLTYCREHAQAASRADNVHKKAAGHTGNSVPEDTISRHIHARGGCPENQPAGITGPGMKHVKVFVLKLLTVKICDTAFIASRDGFDLLG